jgi:hypothetical protein
MKILGETYAFAVFAEIERRCRIASLVSGYSKGE